MTRKLRWLVPFLALAATMVAGTASAAAAPTVQLDGVRTTLWTDPATTKVLLANKIVPLPTYGTHVDVKWTPQGPSIGLWLPDPPRPGRRGHAGRPHQPHRRPQVRQPRQRQAAVADELPDRDRRASASDRDRQRRPEGACSILRLDLSKATVSKPLPYVRVGNVGAYLNSTAAGALNSALGVSFFAPGIKLGTAYVNAHVAG